MPAQAIKYETTKIEPTQSAAEIAQLVQRYGASRVELRWNERAELEGIRFALRTDGMGEVPVRIIARTEGVQKILAEAKRTWSKQQVREHALRIAWRHLRDLTEQLLLAVQLGLRDVGSAFMADIEVWDDVREETVTMAEFLSTRAQLAPGERGLLLRSGPEAR
jgi:hypothetical protein